MLRSYFDVFATLQLIYPDLKLGAEGSETMLATKEIVNGIRYEPRDITTSGCGQIIQRGLLFRSERYFHT